MVHYADTFNQHFVEWLRSACTESSVPDPGEEFAQQLLKRLGPATADWIGFGLQQGLIVDSGNSFSVRGKGKWKWFSIKRPGPRCNWEAFFHVASYLRLVGPCRERDLDLDFEENGMDLTVRQSSEFIWYIEVKEKQDDGVQLIADLNNYGQQGVDLSLMDKRAPGQKRETSLPKAKYLVKYQPKYFSVVALNYERHFRVESGNGTTFKLVESRPPFDMSTTPPKAKPTTA